MHRKSLLGLVCGVALIAGVAHVVRSWTTVERPRLAHGEDGGSLVVRSGDAENRSALLPAAEPGSVTPIAPSSGGLADLTGDSAAHAGLPAAHADLTPAEQKQVNKLQKALDKLAAKSAKTEAKLAKLSEALELAQAELLAAQDLPEGAAKDKALAKAQKKLAKSQGKVDGAAAKLAGQQDKSDDLTAQIVLLDPTHFAEVPGLSAPEQMAVVTAGDDGGGESGFLPGGAGSFLLGPGDFPPGSDFVTDHASAYVYDPSMDVLQMVNMILCMLAQTGYDEMVNQGTYIAQVDEALCDQGGGNQSSGETGQSSGGQSEMPSLWVVHSEREDDQSDEFVKCWVPNDDEHGQGPGSIRVKVKVVEGVSDVDPFGEFGLNFAGVPLGADVEDAFEHGFLKTLDVLDGFIGFSLFHSHGDLDASPFPENENAEVVQANVNMFDDQSQGVARIRRQWRENHQPQGDTGVQTDEFLLAFNDQTVLRVKNGDPGECLSRTEFAANTWRYNLYEAQGEDAGQRVARNGGFGIETESGQYGWIGYYGLWLPQNVQVQTGDVVTKSNYGEGPGEQFTLVSAPGKLIRNTRQTLLLSEADGETFTWWDFGPPPDGGGGPPPPPSPPTQYKVDYDAQGGNFLKIGTVTMDGQFDPFEVPELIDVEAMGGFLQMWSESLGGSVSYVAGSDSLTYFAQTFVNGSDAIFADGDDVALYGFFDCLDHEITAAQAEAGQVYLPNSFEVALPHRYVFRKSDLTLYDDAEGTGQNLVAAGLAEGEVPQMGPFTWGLRSGPLLATLEGVTEVFQSWNQPVFYTYETGPNSWNHYATVKNADGEFVSFDPPLQFTYTHTTENDANGDATFDDDKFLLSYNGDGDLFGIPMQPTDLDGDGHPDRFYPVFNIADGVLMGPTGTEYAVRAIQQELTLQPAPGGCSGQTTDPVASLQLPQAADYVAPDIGPKPLIADPPAVIAGEVQVAEPE